MTAYVACKECGTVVGVLEDIDFKERLKTIISTQQGVDRHITQLEMKIEELARENKYVEHTNSIVCQINNKIR